MAIASASSGQHRAVRGDAGAGGDQHVTLVVIARLQAKAPVGPACLQLVANFQALEQGRGRAAGHEAHRDLHCLARPQRMIVDGRQRIAALGRRAIGVVEMDLDELAGLEIQRLPVVTDELTVGHGGR